MTVSSLSTASLNTSSLYLVFLSLVLLSLVLMNAGCSGGTPPSEHSAEQAAELVRSGSPPARPAEPPQYTPEGSSLYAYDAVWTNQDAEVMKLGDLSGRPVLMSMIFTSCAHACPMIVHDMKRLGGQLPEDLQDDVRYVLVSVDPERDTPEVLRRFAEGHGLDTSRWTLLRGDEERVRMLAALLGVRYRSQADGQFAHTSLISVLNQKGEIVYRQEGVGAPSDSAGGALRELLAASR